MSKEKFMLVSLKEAQAKQLAQVLSNPTATRILDYLTKKEATESEVAKDLDIPLSTVHYNLKQLVKSKLVISEEFHYSEKGREVNHYKLANQYIIIAPQEEKDSLLSRLKNILPGMVVFAAAAIALKAAQLFSAGSAVGEGVQMMALERSADAMMVAEEAAPALPWWQSPMIDYFILGGIFVLLVLVAWEIIGYYRARR